MNEETLRIYKNIKKEGIEPSIDETIEDIVTSDGTAVYVTGKELTEIIMKLLLKLYKLDFRNNNNGKSIIDENIYVLQTTRKGEVINIYTKDF